jgi:antitoxin component YwqK of YwqJK toxin-antitoxin module
MQTIKWLIFLLLFGIGVYFIFRESIPQPVDQNQSKTDSIKVDVRKRFDENGLLKADVEMVNGINHGKAHNYYTNGTVHSEITYVNGVKEGNSIWFYENGIAYRISPYKNNKIDGIQKKYYKSGKLMAEIPYSNDVLIEGTKEYSETGTLLINEPPFKIKWIPNADKSNALIEFTSKKKDIIEAIVVKYNLNGKLTENTYQILGKQLTIPLSFKESAIPAVTVMVTYKTNLNNRRIVSALMN